MNDNNHDNKATLYEYAHQSGVPVVKVDRRKLDPGIANPGVRHKVCLPARGICVYIYIYMCVCIYAFIYVCLHIYIYILCLHIYIYIYI